MKLHIFVLLLLSVAAVAQKKTPALTVEKKPLSQEVYDGWKEISYTGITPDGTNAAFLINPQEGDGKLLVTNLVNGKTDSVLRAAEVALTFDSRFVVFKIKPEKEKVKELRRQKKKKEDLPKDSLGIFTLANRSLQRVPDVRSYKVPEKAGGWLAYQIETKKEEKKKEEKKPDSVVASAKPKKKARKNSDDNGYTLVLQSLANQTSTEFGYVKDYLFARRGTGLLFVTTGNDSTMVAGVYWYDLQTLALRQLHEGKAKYKYKGLAINEAGDHISFLLDSDTTKALQRHHEIFHWKKGEDRASVLVHEKTSGIPADWLISEHSTPLFSKDGKFLFAGSLPRSPLPDTTKLEEETVRVDIWNWRDSVLQSQQNKQLDSEKKRSYLFAMDLSSRTLRQLAGPTIPNILLGDEGNAEVALGLSDRPYRWSNFYDNSGHNDVYTVNVRTGARQLIRQKLKGNVAISPRAKYIYWFSLPDTNWFCYSMATGRTQPVTKGMAVPIVDEENDEPDYPRQYGVAGWLADDARMLIYDRYDIWQIDPENQTPPVNLTKTGREKRIRFRYLKLDPEERFIREGSTLLLAAFHEVTRMSGYYSLNLKRGNLSNY